jgi:hypothetical protein
MLNGRLYRGAFVPVLVALAVAAFSLGGQPSPATTTLAPDAFEGQRAFEEAQSLASQFRDRRPGSSGDERLAAHVAAALRAFGGAAAGGFSVHVSHVEGQTIEGERTLATVVAERPGSTVASPIVVVAHRDAAAAGDVGDMTATAALLELARVFAARETKRTIVLVSTSGGSGGDAGAAALQESLAEAGLHGPYDAVIVLGDLASKRLRAPVVVPYSDGLGQAPLALARTVEAAIGAQAGWSPGAPSTLGELAHLSFPVAVGEQGVLDAQRLPAVLVQASGERGPRAPQALSGARLEGLGRGVLSAIDALDTAPDEPAAQETGLVLAHKVVPEWALRLLFGTLLLGPLITAADGLARLRRRREPIGRWTLWTLSCALPFFCCALLCWLLGELGIIAAAPSVPVPAGAVPLDGAAVTALVAVGLTFVLAWMLWSVLLRRLSPDTRSSAPDPDVAGLAIVFVLAVLAIVVWIGNPYTALLLIPALHIWLLLAAPELRPPRPAALALLAVGLVPLGLLLAFYARQLGLGPAMLSWSALLLLAGGHVGLGSALLWSVALGCVAGALRLVLRAPTDPLEPRSGARTEVTIRGPLSYAGPGSLGGTESALRP